jgi:DNA-binding Lrp family transcriptional regulator
LKGLGAIERQMSQPIDIDEIDVMILKALIKDARARLKDVAEDCGKSSVAVLKRIERLRSLGVITGATLFVRPDVLGLPVIATMGINSSRKHEDKIINLIDKQINLVDPSASIGDFDLFTLVYAKDLAELDRISGVVKQRSGARKVTVILWTGPAHMIFGNIDIQPKRS